MYKLMVVDDEPIIRSGIRYSIPWSELDAEVVAEAGNGLDAAEKAVAVQPDIIITDIRMPMMDGLELIRHVRDRLPYTHFILLSGYSDVAYLKQAISIGVQEYVFKNANYEEIVAAVRKVTALIEKERELRNRSIRRDNLLDENLALIRSTLMQQLLTGGPEGLSDRLRELGVTLEGPRFCLLAVPGAAAQRWQTVARLNELLAGYSPFITCGEGGVVTAVLNLPEDVDLAARFSGLKSALQGKGAAPMAVVCSPVLTSAAELVGARTLVLEALDALFWFSGQPLLIADRHVSAPIQRADLFALEGRCIAAFVSKSNARMQSDLKCYFSFLQRHCLPRKDFLASVTRLLVSINALEQNEDILRFMDEIELMGYEEIFDRIGERIWLGSQHADSRRDLADQAKDYIAAHLTESLTLESVAGNMYISPGYLSRLFKEKNGVGFKEYVQECRLNRAKELLADPKLKTYEIATMSGFRDYKHFSQTFLKCCGCSAREYRKGCKPPGDTR